MSFEFPNRFENLKNLFGIFRCSILLQQKNFIFDIYLFVIFLLSFMVSWLIFATVWYTIAYMHGDLNIRDNETQSNDYNYNLINANHFNLTDLNTDNVINYVKLLDMHEIGVDNLIKLYETLTSNDNKNNVNLNTSNYLKDLLIAKITSQLTE